MNRTLYRIGEGKFVKFVKIMFVLIKFWFFIATIHLFCKIVLNQSRGVFRTQTKIYDAAFLRKQLTAKSC